MRYSTVRGFTEYRASGRSVRLECTLDDDRTDPESDRRTVPVTVEFLAPDAFRFSLDANPEVTDRGESSSLDGEAVSAPVDLSVAEEDGELTLTTGDLRVAIGRDEWSFHVEDRDGNTLLNEQREPIGPRGVDGLDPLGFAEESINDGTLRVTETRTALSLDPDEHLYGLGEKFTSLDKRGQRIDSWTVKAHGTETEKAYKNVPFYLSTRGYGLLVDTTSRGEFDLGATTTGAMSIDVAGDSLSFVVFCGSDFEDVLRRYTALTGRSRVPPKWSFGLWMSRASYESREEVEDVATRLREEDVPCDVLHLDPAWLRDGNACDLEWDEQSFPEPEGMIDGLHDDGFRVSLWEHPYVPVGTAAFEEGVENGYFVADGEGKPYVLDGLVLDQDRGAIVDFTDQVAVEWWQAKHRRLLGMGVDAFKTDFGEDVPDDAVFSDGRSGRTVHNVYPNLYNRAVDEVVVEERGSSETVTWGRSAWTGGQRYPLYWGGDPSCTFEGMASALRGGLSLSLSGFPFWSHDVGGFWGEPSEELYVRWAQFGLLSSHARCHGVTPREPWEFGEEAMEIFRKFARLRYRLLPYLYSLAVEASRTGLPVVRPLVLEYPDDPATHDLDDQFLLGPNLLVAPVFDSDGQVDVYLPDDEWVDFWTGERVQGPRTLRREVPLDSVPLFVRSGSVLPMREPTRTVCEGLPDSLELSVTLATTGASTAEFGLYGDGAEEPIEVAVSTNADRSELAFELDRSDRFDTVEATVDGLGCAPETVSLNDEPQPRRDQNEGEGGWTYDGEAGDLELRILPT